MIDKVWNEGNLQDAWKRVKANNGASGVDGKTVHWFNENAQRELDHIHNLLVSGTYEPMSVLRQYIPKPGSQELRPLGIPTVRDRVVQTSLRQVMEPIFEKVFAKHSYGFIPGRGCHDAIRMVKAALNEGFIWIVDADLRRYFDTIPHEKLMALVERHIADSRVLELVRKYLKQGIMCYLSRFLMAFAAR